MKKSLMLVFLIIVPLICLSQTFPSEPFKRDLSIDPTTHIAFAVQTNSLTNESYQTKLMTFPFNDGDPGFSYNPNGDVKSWSPFKVVFSVNKVNENNGCFESLEKTIRVILNFQSGQLMIDNINDLNDLINFSRGSSVEEEVTMFLTSFKQYFPLKVKPETLEQALSGITDYFQDRYQTFMDPTGGAVAVGIIAVICIWECPIIVGCAIGAGGFNIYWAQCVGVAPSK